MKLSEFKLTKTVNKENKIIYSLNNLTIKADEYYNILKIGGIKSDHDLIYFNHRKIQKMLEMSGEKLYEVIRETTGGKLFQERKIETLKILEKTEEEDERSQGLLEELERKILTLKKGKKNWNKYDKEDKALQTIKFVLYQKKEQNFEKQITKLKVSIESLMEKIDIEKKLKKEKEYQKENQKVKIKMKKESEIKLVKQEADWERLLKKEMGTEKNLLTRQIIQGLENHKLNEKNGSKKMQRLRVIEQEYKEKLAQKLQFENSIEQTKKQMISQMSQSTSFDSQQRLAEENCLKSLKDMDSKILEMDQKQVLKRSKETSIKNKIEGLKNDLNKLLDSLSIKGNKWDGLKDQKYEIMMEENRLTGKYQKIEEKIISFKSQLERFYGGTNVYSIIRLVQEAKKRKMKGILGILAELIEISNSKLYSLFDLMFKDKMFSLVVLEEKHVIPLIALNKELKGGRIKILPLSWYPKNSNSINKSSLQNNTMNNSLNETRDEEFISMDSYIQIKTEYKDHDYSDQLTTCVYDCFKNSIIVRHTEMGFAISKEKKVNCVTMEGQVIYSGGFLTKAGHFSQKHQNLKNFFLLNNHLNLKAEKQKEIDNCKQNMNKVKFTEKKISEEIDLNQNEILKIKKLIDQNYLGIPSGIYV